MSTQSLLTMQTWKLLKTGLHCKVAFQVSCSVKWDRLPAVTSNCVLLSMHTPEMKPSLVPTIASPLQLSVAPYSGRTVSSCGSYWPEGPARMRMWTPMTSLTTCWRGVGFRSRSTALTHCKDFFFGLRCLISSILTLTWMSSLQLFHHAGMLGPRVWVQT